MNRFFTRYASWRTIALPALVFVWCLGYASGYWLCIPQEAEYIDLFRSVSVDGTAFSRLLITSLLSVFLSALIFRYAAPYLILPIIFAKSFASGYCHSLVLWCFGRAAWLIFALFWFLKSISNVILIDYWIANLAYTKKWDVVRLRRIVAIYLLVSILECYLIRPFGIELISKY